MLFGILHRSVMGQVLRAFLLALLTLTTIIVLFMVMAEATRNGLAPQAVIKMIPYIVPGTLPYTIPVALLFAVSVVYGRLASDNEVVAVKAAGCSAWILIGPSLMLGMAVCVVLVALSGEIIPRSNFAFKMALFKDAEETFYTVLKREREFNNPRWPVFVGVKDVKDRLLIGPTFKHRAKGFGNANVFDATVQADTAVIHFDGPRNMVVVTLENAVMQGRDFSSSPHLVIEYPLPEGASSLIPDKRVQEMTSREITIENGKVLESLHTERSRQAVAASLWIASGRIDRVYWPDIGNVYRNDARWKRQTNELQTERHARFALATGPLFFVLIGAPVGMLFAKRDFLSAFITCFVPIIILYYPLVMAGMNMGKEGIIGPWIVWSGNLVLGLIAWCFALPPVVKH